MRTWELSVPLDEASPTPLFVQIARALAEDRQGDPAAAWAERALQAGVGFSHGGQYTFDNKPYSAVRLGFAALKEGELRDAVRRMARVLPRR